MLKECGTSVAMANAFSEVKSVCTYHTASNDEDGVAQVLEEMLFSRNNICLRPSLFFEEDVSFCESEPLDK
jgi:3-deoxy-D-manno-octulosonate 8-phosphate phosphatase KdsC-like HAD superfamily phosphatase